MFTGVIIEESLSDTSILNLVNIISTKVSPVTDKHKTPWVTQWTMHTIETPPHNAEKIAAEISRAFDTTHEHSWYADYKNDTTHYIIFPNKVFKIDRRSEKEYQEASEYGMSLGIPDYQLNFAPNIIK